MSGNNTSGYEIRQGLLGQAQDILQTNAQMHYERTKEWVPVTTEAIIAEAEKLNGFVQRKSRAGEGRPRRAAEARAMARPGWDPNQPLPIEPTKREMKERLNRWSAEDLAREKSIAKEKEE